MFYNKQSKFKYSYVSEIDQFLQMLDNLPGAKCNARLEEEQKYQRIFNLRDNKHGSKLNEDLQWKEF
jgi:hypothetical protein